MRQNRRNKAASALILGILGVFALMAQGCQSVEERKEQISKLQTDIEAMNAQRKFIAYPKEVSLNSTVKELAELALELAEYHEDRVGLIPNAKAQATQYYQIAENLYDGSQKGNYYITEIKWFGIDDNKSWVRYCWSENTPPMIGLSILGGISVPVTIVASFHDFIVALGTTRDAKQDIEKLPSRIHDQAQAGLERVNKISDNDWDALKDKGHLPNLDVTLSQTTSLTHQNRDLVKMLDGKSFAETDKKNAIACKECLSVPTTLDPTGIQKIWNNLFIDILANEEGKDIPYIWEQQLKVDLINMPGTDKEPNQIRVQIHATAYIPRRKLLGFVNEQSKNHSNQDYQLEFKLIEGRM